MPIRERPVLTEDALNIALTEDIAGLLTAIDSFDTTVNTTLAANP